jgi:F420H(2)-dependent quinone reductase
MTSVITRNVPPTALVRAINPVARLLLRSPLHGLIDSAVLLLHVTGRKTGRRYDIPVGYAALEDRLVVVTVARWRVNLRGGGDVEVTRHGSRRPMHALLDEDPAAVAVAYDSVIEHLGWPRASRQLGIATAHGYRPTLLELRVAAQAGGWAVITLTAPGH